MKKRKLTAASKFHIGDLYLFHSRNPHCPPATFHNKTTNGVIYLEHSTLDLLHFRLWHKLPKRYRYYRLATRDELRDYMYSLAIWESISSLVSSAKILIYNDYSISFAQSIMYPEFRFKISIYSL